MAQTTKQTTRGQALSMCSGAHEKIDNNIWPAFDVRFQGI